MEAEPVVSESEQTLSIYDHNYPTQSSQSGADQIQPPPSADSTADALMNESQSDPTPISVVQEEHGSVSMAEVEQHREVASRDGNEGVVSSDEAHEQGHEDAQNNQEDPSVDSHRLTISQNQAEVISGDTQPMTSEGNHATQPEQTRDSSNDDAMDLGPDSIRAEGGAVSADDAQDGLDSSQAASSSTAASNTNPTSDLNSSPDALSSPSDLQAPGAYPSTPPTTSDSATSSAPRIQFFRLPYLHPDGSPALLEFTSAPLPSMPPESPPYTPTRPMFVPRGASPLPFAFIFDATSNAAWPISEIPPVRPSSTAAPETPSQPHSNASAESASAHETSSSTSSAIAPSSSSPVDAQPDGARNIAFVNETSSNETTTNTYRINPSNPRLIADPPFHVMIDFNFGGGHNQVVEELDSKRAERFCKNLEKADAELRERMLRVGLGELGIYGNNNEVGGSALGCAVCLEQYTDDDRPAWLDSASTESKASDSEVVCVPCEGHHTLHRGCLKDWLSNIKPSKWNCPFCRGFIIDGEKVPSGLENSKERMEAEKKQKTIRSLREEVRFRERNFGWRCDSRACLGFYPEDPIFSEASKRESDAYPRMINRDAEGSTTSSIDMKLLSLSPCHHQIHLGCLLTELRVRDGLLDHHEDEDEDDDDDDEEEQEQGIDLKGERESSLEARDQSASLPDLDSERLAQPQNIHFEHSRADVVGTDIKLSEKQINQTKTLSNNKNNDSGFEMDFRTEDVKFAEEEQVVTKGKWIDCPCCRKSCWVELPIKKRNKNKTKRLA